MSQQIHEDYGRVLPHAKKHLYNKGVLNVDNYTELSEEERTEKIKRESIWKIDYQDLKDKGHHPAVGHFLKAIYSALSSKPKYDSKYLGEVTGDPFKDKQIISLIYVHMVNKFKSGMDALGYDLHGSLVNGGIVNGSKENVADGLSGYIKKAYPKNTNLGGLFLNFYNDYRLGNEDIDEIVTDLSKVFPEHEIFFNSYSGRNLINNWSYLQFSNRFKNLKNLRQVFNASWRKAEQEQWKGLVVDDVVIENNLPLNELFNTNNEVVTNEKLMQIVKGIIDTKIRINRSGKIAIQIQNGLEQKHLSNIVRHGYDYLADIKNVDSQKLEEVFGFDGTQWGNWVSEKNERQNFLNLTYYGFADLAQVLDIPLSQISLPNDHGKVALAFGSQGKGRGGSAFYNINHKYFHFNRLNGAGAVAHEWFHAYDNYLFDKFVKSRDLSDDLSSEILNRAAKNYSPFFSSLVYYTIEKHIDNLEFSSIDDEYFEHLGIKKDLDILKEFDPHITDLVTGWFLPNVIEVKRDNISSLENFLKDDSQKHTMAASEKLMELFDNDIAEYKTLFKNMEFALSITDANDGKLRGNWSALNGTFWKILGKENLYADVFYSSSQKYYFTHKDEINKKLYERISEYAQYYHNKDTLNNQRQQFNDMVTDFVVESLDKFKTEMQTNKEWQSHVVDYALKNKGDEYILNRKRVTNTFYKTPLFNLLQDYVKSKLAIDFGLRFNDFLENVPSRMIADSLKDRKESLPRFITNTLIEMCVNSSQKTIAEILFEHGVEFKMIQPKPMFTSGALFLDSIVGKKYFSLPEEMFARASEHAVGVKVVNTFLNNSAYLYEQSMNFLVYPEEGDAQKYAKQIFASVKHHIPEGFNLDLKKFPYINNQFDMQTEVIDVEVVNSEKEPVKRKRGRPRKNSA